MTFWPAERYHQNYYVNNRNGIGFIAWCLDETNTSLRSGASSEADESSSFGATVGNY